MTGALVYVPNEFSPESVGERTNSKVEPPIAEWPPTWLKVYRAWQLTFPLVFIAINLQIRESNQVLGFSCLDRAYMPTKAANNIHLV